MSSFNLGSVCVSEVYDNELGFSRLYTDNDMLVVLIADDYGTGWCTENTKYGKQLLMDSRIIRFYWDTYLKDEGIPATDADTTPLKEFLASLGIQGVCVDEHNLPLIDFVSKGSRFRVKGYGGKESIIRFDKGVDFLSA
jgi:hypothetical protein